jgi:hypothetical protein
MMKLLILQFLHTPITSSLSGPNILLSTLFSNTLSLVFLPDVSHTYRTTGKIIALYILSLTSLDSRQEERRFRTEWYQALAEFNLVYSVLVSP